MRTNQDPYFISCKVVHPSSFYYLIFHRRILLKHITPHSRTTSSGSNQTADFIKCSNNGVVINRRRCHPRTNALLLHGGQWGITVHIHKPFFRLTFFWNLLLSCTFCLGSTGFEIYVHHTLRPSKEGQQLFSYFTSYFVNEMLCYNSQKHAEYTLESKKEMLPCLFFINYVIWYFIYVTLHFSLWKTA